MKEVVEVFKSHKSWNDIKNISSILIEAGCQCYLVGGCIRDALINKPLKDFDIVTDAKPDEMSSLFSKTIDVGAQFGVVVVVINSQPYEVATLREESGYSDSRHPDKIVYTKTIEKDSKRRDFTMNAVYFDFKTEQFKDPQKGLSAIHKNTIEAVGAAEDRFEEDSLRALRAFRFMAQTGFEFSNNLKNSLKKYDKSRFLVSKERITSELDKTFESKNNLKTLKAMNDLGFIEFFFKKSEYKDLALSRLARWYDLLDPIFDFESFKLKKDDQKTIEWLNKNKNFQLDNENLFKTLKTLAHTDFIRLKEVLDLGESAESKVEELKKEYLVDGKMPPPLLSGKDLLAIGHKPGSALGEILAKAYEAQVLQKIKKPEVLIQALSLK